MVNKIILCYFLICISPYEGVGATPITNTYKLKIFGWQWPWNYGASATLSKTIRLMWSGATGTLKAYKPIPSVGHASAGCLVSSVKGVYIPDLKQQKIQFAIYPQKSIKLTTQFPTIQIVNQYTYDPPLVLTTSKCALNKDKVKCSAGIGAQQIIMTLTVDVNELPFVINSGEWIFTLWVDGRTPNSAQTNIKYFSRVFGYYDDLSASGQLVELQTCDKKYQEWSQANQSFTQYLTAINPVFPLIEGIRDYFEFSFKTNFPYYDFGEFNLDLNFLALSNQNSKQNLRCAIYKNNEITHDFLQLSLSNLYQVKIKYREISSVTPTEMGLQSYKFKCHGAKITSSGLTAGAKLAVAYFVGNTRVAYGNTTDLNNAYNIKQLTEELEYANVTFTKGFSAVGQSSNYTFHIFPKDPQFLYSNWTTPRILFAQGSTIFIEFPRDIAPRFSKGGKIYCEQENERIPCSIIGERRISFPSTVDLNPNFTYGYNFTVYGVSQPYTLSKYNYLYFAIAANSSDIANITYETESLKDTSPYLQTYQPLRINKFSVNTTQTKGNQIISLEIVIPKDAMVDGTPMFIEFSDEYQENFFTKFIPYCMLYNVIDNNNEAPHNYAANCSLIKGNRVQIFLSNDSENNSTRRYKLEVQDIPGPIYPTNGNNMPLVYICSNSSMPTVPIYRSSNCTTNSTSVPFTLGNYTEDQILTWTNSSPIIYKGTFRTIISLELQSKQKFQSEITSLGFTSRTVFEQFKFQPSVMKIQTGKSKVSWWVSPLPDTRIGLYQLNFFDNYTQKYSAIPPLNVQVLEGQYKLIPNIKEIEVAYKSYSFPIIFDFTEALPLENLIIQGAIYDETLQQESDYFALENSRQIITYNENDQIYQLIFRVTGTKERNSIDANNSITAFIDFTLSGVNSQSYSIESYCCKIKYVELENLAPILTFNNIVDSSIPGEQEFQARCSELGMLYYVVSQDFNLVESASYKDIQKESIKKNVQETLLHSYAENPNRTIYGYKFVTLKQSLSSVLIKNKLQSEAEYKIKMVCVNLFDQSSKTITRAFKQVSNGGQPVIMQLEFQSTSQLGTNSLTTLNSNQILEAVCILSEIISKERDSVWAPNGQKCLTDITNSRFLLESFVEIGESSISKDDNETQSYYFIAIPDYFIQSETIVQDISEILNSEEFEIKFKQNSISLASLNLYTHSVITNTKMTPKINTPYIECTEETISLTFTMQQTNGFIFAGLIPYNQTAIPPQSLELKKLSTNSYNFSAHLTQFYIKDEPIKITFSGLTKDTSYQCYWMGTNEDAQDLAYETRIEKSLRIMTEGRTSNHAERVSEFILGVVLMLVLVIL